ncbi:MAG: SDR family NAD(P)-dependent oxidoreductase [Deltaproteobacteria bacterium]|nr:SDR family NAD(P)-dependent oxidoreductase [Deltaproteobacteria bacterium]
MRTTFGVERDDKFSLADHSTVRKLAAWLEDRAHLAAARSFIEHDGDDVSEPLSDPASDLPRSFWVRRPALVPRPCTVIASLRGRKVRLLGEGQVTEALERALQGRGASVVHIVDPDAPQPDVDAVIDVAADALEAFVAAKALVGRPPRDWLCLTMLGEMHGMTPDQAFFDGSRAGFTKALGREWESCQARVVDVSPDRGVDSIAELLCDELAAPDGSPEVFHGPDGVRKVVALAVESHPPALAKPKVGQVVLATGGGRGVTASVVLELARRAPGTFVLVGRTPPLAKPLNEEAAKKQAREELLAAGEKPSPGRIDAKLAGPRAAEEVRRTMEDLLATGSRVEFRSVDMGDVGAVVKLVSDVKSSYGRIDGCIHGAGVEESRLLQDKDLKAFQRVFDGKALGGLTLAERLPESAWLLSMGSVAGRFGNAGQVDYAAANEALAQICKARPRSLHVCWTAWAGVGMAVRGGMQQLLESKGVELMPVVAGASLAVDLIAAEVTGELVVAGRLGNLVPKPNHSFLDSMELEGDTVVARYTLDADRDTWILDHSIDEVPVLPGVIGVEMMAAVATMARPGQPYVGVERVRFDKPVKLYRQQPTEIELRAIPLGEGKVRCTLFSERRSAANKRIRAEHFSATILLGTPPSVSQMPPGFFPEEPINRAAIYKRFFHGTSFQVLRGADSVARDGLAASAQVEHALIAEDLLTSPLALEAAFQAAGLHSMVIDGVMALPAAVEALWLVRQARDGEALTLEVRRVGDLYDVDVDGEDGRVLCLRGFRMVARGPLPERDRFQEPEEGWAETAFGAASPAGLPMDTPAIRWAEARSSEPVEGILSDEELADLRPRGGDKRVTDKRVADRIAGRIAAKRALSSLTGRPFSALRVVNLTTGEPVSEVDGAPGPRVSISHSGGRAVAVVTARGRVGVDIEAVEPRHESFVREWFHDDEAAVHGGDPWKITAGWCAKEAVLKALGAGMALHPRDVRLRRVDRGALEVQLCEEVAARAVSMRLGAPRFELRELEGVLLVWVLFEG